LATTEPEKLPDTILSRCLHFKLASASQDTISNHLADILTKENIKYDNLSLSIIAKNANGSIRDSLSLLEQCIAYCNGNIESSKIALFLGEINSENIEKIISCIINHDAKSLINTVENIESHSNFISLMDSIISIFYKLSLSNIQTELLNDGDPHYLYCKDNSNSISSQDLQLYYQIAISSKNDFRDCPSKKDHFIMTILRMIYFSGSNESPKNTTYKKTEPKDHNESIPSNSLKSVEENVPETISHKWMDAVQNMDLTGLTMHLAMQSVMVGIDTDSPTLHINQDKKDIYPKLCIDDLILKIKKHFNINFKINIEYSAGLLTPIVFESMKNENEVNTRYDKVKDSPDINKLQKVFGANINKESIKKIIE
jgi:DNA polymerase-3 subunit gamma/tau